MPRSPHYHTFIFLMKNLTFKTCDYFNNFNTSVPIRNQYLERTAIKCYTQRKKKIDKTR